MARQDIYTAITNTILTQLSHGTRPWIKPWNSSGMSQRPLRHDGTPYRGVNILSLWASTMDHGYESPYWMTYNKAQELGAQVRRGEKSTLVVYGSIFSKTVPNEQGADEERSIPFLRGYSVFNAHQMDGLPEQYFPTSTTPAPAQERIASADAFFAATQARVVDGGDKAYYSPSQDYIGMPALARFDDAVGYYSTLAHEMAHWTRHPSRLDRSFGQKRFGDLGYAMEELVAELGAAFLCADLALELEPRSDHASYIDSWIQVLQRDTKAVFTAASHAQKAVEHLHSYGGLTPSPDSQ